MRLRRSAKLAIVVFCFALCGAALFGNRWLELRRRNVRPGELYDVVWEQIAAMRDSDWPRAYRQVSSGFAEKYNVESFVELIRADYPSLRRPYHVEFGALHQAGPTALLQAYFVFAGGEVVPCLYRLVNEDGGWKIDAARVLRRQQLKQRMEGLRM